MRYLHLKFKNCGLICCKKSPIQHLNRDDGEFGKHTADGKSVGHDLTNPIPYTLLSNVLHVLCGEIPVPSKRKTIFKRIKELDDIAKEAYIKYDYDLKLTEKGYPKWSENFQTNKWNWNCGKKITTNFKIYNGEIKTCNGVYNHDYLKRAFNNNEEYHLLLDFIKDIIGYNPTQKIMSDVIYDLSKHWEDEGFKEKVNEFIGTINLNGGWKNALFNIKCTTANSYVQSRTPVFVSRGVANITHLDGEIVVGIDNDNIINKINHGEGFATLLEGGIVYVVGFGKYMPYANIEDDFQRIK